LFAVRHSAARDNPQGHSVVFDAKVLSPEEFMASGMTKTQLTRHLAEKLGTNNKTAATFLEHLADTAIKETKKNGVFVVPGLGRLVKAHRKARMGRNPRTGEPIQIEAKTVVKFRVAKSALEDIAPPPDRKIKKMKP
jgi:DNA-binding protein HU-beta